MDLEKLDTTPFEAEEFLRRRSVRRRTAQAGRARRRPAGRRLGASMLVKIGVCAGVLLLVLALELFVLPSDRTAVETDADAPAATDGGADGTPGRLQFVDGGGLIGVFAGSARWSLPVQADTAAVSEEGELLEIGAAAGASVSASAGGEVRAIGEDPALGPYVRIHHGEDLESIYYHLSDIRVEEGQPLLLGDTLGTVPEDGKLYLRVLKTGAPQQIDRYMSVPEGD